MKNLLAPLAVVGTVLASTSAFAVGVSAIDGTVATQATEDLIATVTMVGGITIGAAVVAVAFKWAKGAIFG
jgi:hypothetical protein